MIFSLVIIIVIGVVAFFHYVQGFFSATLSAVLTIIAAALAVSYHETIVESVFGGKAAGVSHAMALSLTFGLTYLILRVLFDKMVPGNVRFPVLVDKIGGGAMGLVAGVFAAGVVALTAQYMPLMPSIAGYARYTVDDREVTLPSIGGARMTTSRMFDELKSQKPGQFDPADKAKMMVPADDLLLQTVSHLSDGGSLSGKQKLTAIHPSLPDELFAQRLGVQTGSTRVVTNTGVTSVELFQAPSLKFRDHEFKGMRTIDLKGLPVSGTTIKPSTKQVLLIVRVMFTRYASDSDHWVRFSPGSARLVTHVPGGAEGEMVNYYPIGTVEAGQTLYLSKPDDFLLAKDDGGIDLAYLVDKSGLVAGGGTGSTLRVSEGTFFEFKRLARTDLGGKTISNAYKPVEVVKVERKRLTSDEEADAQAAAKPAEPAADPKADELKQRLVGNWMGTSDAGQLIIDFAADGALKITSTPRNAPPNISSGAWESVRSDGDNKLIIKRTIGPSSAEATITFDGNDKLTLTSATTPKPIELTRR